MDDDFQTLEDHEVNIFAMLNSKFTICQNKVKFLQEKAKHDDMDSDIRLALDKSVGGIHIGVGF